MNYSVEKKALRIRVFGVVQGVGFRPFIFRIAKRFGYHGWVKNFGKGVEIFLERENKNYKDFNDFLSALENEKPPLAEIKSIKIYNENIKHFDDFTILPSKEEESFVFISPDISVCEDCLRELFNPDDRRYRYPFINCTNCGPRYTIIKKLPYDRSKTTMENFKLCEKCSKEYSSPEDRRFHAQPVACDECGPHVSLINSKDRSILYEKDSSIFKAQQFLREGFILAVKGLGGFHLFSNPFNLETTNRMRRFKKRERKPFALMAKDIYTIKKYCYVSPEEEKFLLSPRRPIVLLKKKRDIEKIAPFLDELGIMLPYTPLHHLLINNLDLLIATSSNFAESPIIKDDKEKELYEISDFVLTHNRPIHMRVDDSVLKISNGKPLFLRRARGYVSEPLEVPEELKIEKHLIALGGELKNTISFYKNGYIIPSQYLGDLKDWRNQKYLREALNHIKKLFEVNPEVVITDLHPDFFTTNYAEKMGIRHLKVQHHFAHILATMVENQISPDEKILGVALDGVGFGTDNRIWGGEFLICDYRNFNRFAHFEYVPQPGGDKATKEPWRMALSYLFHNSPDKNLNLDFIKAIESFRYIEDSKIKSVLEILKKEIYSPLTSSAGRLFDAVSFLIGTSPETTDYEAEAPMRMESIVENNFFESYDFEIIKRKAISISFKKTIQGIISDLNKINAARIASKFHNTLAKTVLEISKIAVNQEKIKKVLLGGGVFLNRILLERTIKLLSDNGIKVIRPEKFSPNDESISLGQIAYGLGFFINNKSIHK
ncbi:MAG: carbamoyltransferase HypF [Acidobacteriota bacterium]